MYKQIDMYMYIYIYIYIYMYTCMHTIDNYIISNTILYIYIYICISEFREKTRGKMTAWWRLRRALGEVPAVVRRATIEAAQECKSARSLLFSPLRSPRGRLSGGSPDFWRLRPTRVGSRPKRLGQKNKKTSAERVAVHPEPPKSLGSQLSPSRL